MRFYIPVGPNKTGLAWFSLMLIHRNKLKIIFFKFLETRAPDSSIVTKIKKFFTENKWNMFDMLIFLTFYLTLSIRFSPIYGKVYYIASETCYESARVLYCINSILWYIRILPMISCVPFWGPKIIIIQVINNFHA